MRVHICLQQKSGKESNEADVEFVLYMLISYKYGTSFRYAAPDGLLKVKIPILFMQKKKDTRELILSQTYKLLFTYSWEAITIEQIENSIGKTRGAIFYFFRNKVELFNAIIEERFMCKLKSSEIENSTLELSIKDFFNQYHAPFERVSLDIKNNYGQVDPNSAVINIIVQARNLYPNFDIILESYLNIEIQYIANHALVMKNNPKLMSIFKTYIQLSYGALLFHSTFCVFDTKKQLQSYINGFTFLIGE